MSTCEVCGREQFGNRPGFNANVCFRLSLPMDRQCWKLGYEREKKRADAEVQQRNDQWDKRKKAETRDHAVREACKAFSESVEAACARALAGDKDRRSLISTLTLVIELAQAFRAMEIL